MQKEYHDAHPIKLGGERRFLRISTISLRYARKYHDERVDLSILNDAMTDPALFAMMVWVGLLHEDKKLEEDSIYELILLEKKENVHKILKAAGGALMEAIEEVKAFGEGAAAEMPEDLSGSKTPENGQKEKVNPKAPTTSGGTREAYGVGLKADATTS